LHIYKNSALRRFLQDLADGDVLAEWNDALTRLSEEVKKAEQLKRFN
jgi:hypothetical protein